MAELTFQSSCRLMVRRERSKVARTLSDIEDELDQLQLAYIESEDEGEQIEIVRKFTHALEEATALDGILRNAAGVTINNWTRET